MADLPVLSFHYLPNLDWFHHFLKGPCILDVHEHYIKQSGRNRAHILSANGPQSLIIPVKKKQQLPMHEVLIENDFQWQRQHWHSICSAYGKAAYFEYYADRFAPFYVQPTATLAQFNASILRALLKILNIPESYQLSTTFVPYLEFDTRKADFLMDYNVKPYPQVFMSKFGFTPHLSILDIVFNMGPDAIDYL